MQETVITILTHLPGKDTEGACTEDVSVLCYHTSRTYYLESNLPVRSNRACKTSLIISLVTSLFEWLIKPVFNTAYFRMRNYILIDTGYLVYYFFF